MENKYYKSFKTIILLILFFFVALTVSCDKQEYIIELQPELICYEALIADKWTWVKPHPIKGTWKHFAFDALYVDIPEDKVRIRDCN